MNRRLYYLSAITGSIASAVLCGCTLVSLRPVLLGRFQIELPILASGVLSLLVGIWSARIKRRFSEPEPLEFSWAPSATLGPGRTRIHRPAGSTFLAIARLLLFRRVVNDAFLQTVADMRQEWEEAMADKRPGLARWTLVKGHIALLLVAATLISGKAMGSLYKAFKLAAK